MNWFGFEISAFLWAFILLNIVNVVIQTVKSIATINCGKTVAAITNAVAYALYTVVVVFMNADGLGILWKALIIGIANLLGVYIVKLMEEKSRKDKLWVVQATIHGELTEKVDTALGLQGVPHNYIPEIGEYTIVNCYCSNQEQSGKVKSILNEYGAKYFVCESKSL